MKKTINIGPALPFLCLLLLTGFQAEACTTCSRPLQNALFDEGFGKLFVQMVVPFAFVWAIVYKLRKLK